MALGAASGIGPGGFTIPAGFKIIHVRADDQPRVAAVARLFTAYTDSLGIDLTYQNYAAELAELPGKYGPPNGALLLLVRSGRDTEEVDIETTDEAVGCVALRALPDVVNGTYSDGNVLCEEDGGEHSSSSRNGHGGTVVRRRRRRAEIKRLYVDPAARGHRLGRALFAAVLDEARRKGYDEVVLDTLAHMTEAQRMYEREGFVRLEEPYYEVAGGGDNDDDKVVEGAENQRQKHPEGTVFYRLEL
ncbi:hypothetical protein PG989_008701 [Apiospora arundinis]